MNGHEILLAFGVPGMVFATCLIIYWLGEREADRFDRSRRKPPGE